MKKYSKEKAEFFRELSNFANSIYLLEFLKQ